MLNDILKYLIGSGDIAKDMENQVKANSIRIKVLEDQNTKLRQTITKMVTAQSYTGKSDNSVSVTQHCT